MYPPGADTVLVRHGEIGTKSEQVGRKMEGQLRDNIAAILSDRGFDDRVERERTRLYVRTDSERIEAVTDAVTDAFGVVSASPAVRREPTVDAICSCLGDAARAHYDGGTFAVRARRAGESEAHPFSSKTLEEEGGTAVWQAAENAGADPTVDLDDPDLTFYIECRADDAFVFLEKRDGPGGLPYGTQRPVVALISGGIDSPVAAWEMMRRGCPVVPLYVDLGEYGGPDHRARAESTVDALARYAPSDHLTLRVAPGGEAVDEIVAQTKKHRMLVLRRFMLLVAEVVAENEGAVGIVTGEAVGQKSSQTTANLRVTSAVTDFPVHRPLLSLDKPSITERARTIGTYDDATIPAGCNRVAPTYPETAASLTELQRVEPDTLDSLARSVAADIDR
ncbi:tRNA sulfurtransferase [Salinibaculum salinum]|uniref:tRNA sulfurtransferase n=1 Tax=Salinibaculum salinum TaxID=3131996 RepID=UPI0030EC0F3A